MNKRITFEAATFNAEWFVDATTARGARSVLPLVLTESEARELASTLNEAEAMREALAFYADKHNHQCLADGSDFFTEVDADGGSAARAILARIEAAKGDRPWKP